MSGGYRLCDVIVAGRDGTARRLRDGGPFRLHEVEDGVTDSLRKWFGVPSLEESKKREEKLNKK